LNSVPATDHQQQNIHQQGVNLCPSHRATNHGIHFTLFPWLHGTSGQLVSQHNITQPHKVTTPPAPHMRVVRTVLLTFIFYFPVETQKAAEVSSHGTTPQR
jgi:hypothetical protein